MNLRLIYILYLVGIVLPVMILVGAVMAYVMKDGQEEPWRAAHFRYQIRTFWLAVLYFGVSYLLMAIFIGYLTGFLALIWYVIRCAKGLSAFEKKAAPHHVNSWLV